MRIDVSNSSEFERLLDRLGTDIVDAAIFRRLHEELGNSVQEFWREFAQSRTFWSLTLRAHVEAILFRLIRAYDTHPSALSLKAWLETIKENLHLFGAAEGANSPDVILRRATPPDLEELDRDLYSVGPEDPLVKKLIALRGNFIAHTNARNIVEELCLEERFTLGWSEIDSLVSRGTTILNRYSVLFKRQSWSTTIVGHDDFRSVLNALRRDLVRRDAELAAEIELGTSAPSA